LPIQFICTTLISNLVKLLNFNYCDILTVSITWVQSWIWPQ